MRHNHPAPKTAGPRIRQEQRTIDAMLGIYCRDHHSRQPASRRGATGRAGGKVSGGSRGRGSTLCAECEQLQRYAHQRLGACPFQEQKPVCNRCEVHCYSPTRRERVREVMRYAGPRMLLRHPWLALLHLLDKLRRVPSLARLRDRSERDGQGR